QAEVGESAVAVEVDDEPGHLAIVHAPDRPTLCRQIRKLQGAGLPVSGAMIEHQDALTVERPILLRLGAQVFPDAEEVTRGRGHCWEALPTSRRRAVGDNQLDVRV